MQQVAEAQHYRVPGPGFLLHGKERHCEALCPGPGEGGQPQSQRDGQLFPGALQFWLALALWTGYQPGFGELGLKSTGLRHRKGVSRAPPSLPCHLLRTWRVEERGLQETQMHSGQQGQPAQVEVLTEEWRRLGGF